MAYKISKYKGKTKIKDLKTGKSAEIDIEQFMNGGYKQVPKYSLGGDDCNGDEDCLERKRIEALTNPLSQYNVKQEELNYIPPGVSVAGQKGFTEESVSTVPSSINQQPRQRVAGLNVEANGIQEGSNLKKQLEDQKLSEKDFTLYSERHSTEGSTPQNTYQIPNPYAGADIPTAAYTLGQSIQSGNKLGIVGSGLKLATGLSRNLVSGLGQANRENQVMKDAAEEERNNRNVIQYGSKYENGGEHLDNFEQGGVKEEELATGEYIKGVDNMNTEEYNSEVEQGEYVQTNEGDIAEVVGNKHSKGGEKIQMEGGDRVLSDKLKVGSKSAKMLSEKYDIKVKYKNTYSDVLDKLRKKLKLDKLVEEDVMLVKKISDQELVEDATTRDLNLQVLAEKKKELNARKEPLEEMRKTAFEELFEMQEDSKPKKKDKDIYSDGGEKGTNPFPKGSAKYRALENFNKIGKTRTPLPQEISSLEDIMGNDPRYIKTVDKEPKGALADMAIQYGVPLGRAEELVAQFKNGGKYVPKFDEGDEFTTNGDDPKATRVSKEEAKKNVTSGKWEQVAPGRYIERGRTSRGGVSYEDAYKNVDKEKYPTLDEFIVAAKKYNQENVQDKHYVAFEGINAKPNKGQELRGPEVEPLQLFQPPTNEATQKGNEEVQPEEESFEATPRPQGMGAFLFPDESPLAPSGLQGTLKPEARFDRVRPTEVDARPYLQDIRDREDSQIQSLEGLSPNVRAAVMSNLRANSQKAESDIRNRIDTANLASQEKAIYTNANIQRQEQNQNNNYRQGYEDRIYQAQAKTEANVRNYLNAGQALNAQRFDDIHNLNLVNASNEDVVYIPGQGFVRKEGSSDKDLLDKSVGHYDDGGYFEYQEFLEWKRNQGKM